MKRRALAAVTTAIQEIDAHLSDRRDPALGLEFDGQIRRFRERLALFEQAIQADQSPEADGAMTWAIADGWPLESSLARMISHAEGVCERLARAGQGHE